MSRGLRYYDSSTPPTPWQAQEMFLAGARVYGGYLSGVQASQIWSPFNWQIVRAAGFSLIGYVVEFGPTAGTAQRAVIAARVQGLSPRWFRICIDQEAGWPDPSPLFCAYVRSQGYQCGIYGTVDAVARQRSGYDFAVVADPDGVPDPPAPPPFTIIQNWWNHTEFGLGVDRGIADPWFYYGVNEMQFMDAGAPINNADLTARRVTIHEWYRRFLHREVENDAAMQAHLATWVSSGAEAVFAEIVDGVEGASNIAAERKVLGL